MTKLLAHKERAYHLQEYAIWQNEDGTYQYKAWDSKDEKLSWITGKAKIVEDVICLMSITSEGQEESVETEFELKVELHQLPKWDKTKYYCVLLGEQEAALIKYCDSGKSLEIGQDDYNAAKEMLQKHGLELAESVDGIL
jgi:hypothetical protein